MKQKHRERKKNFNICIIVDHFPWNIYQVLCAYAHGPKKNKQTNKETHVQDPHPYHLGTKVIT